MNALGFREGSYSPVSDWQVNTDKWISSEPLEKRMSEEKKK